LGQAAKSLFPLFPVRTSNRAILPVLWRDPGKAELLRFGDQGSLYRAALHDGKPVYILVREYPHKGKNAQAYHLVKVVPPPPKKPAKARPVLVPEAAREPESQAALEPAIFAPPEPAPPPPAPPPLPPPPARPLGPTTLTLGTQADDAAKLLADRLRPKPPPPRVEKISAVKRRRNEQRHGPPPGTGKRRKNGR